MAANVFAQSEPPQQPQHVFAQSEPPVISVLVGADSDSVGAPISSGQNSDNTSGGGVKQVWGKPLNGNGNTGAVTAAAAAVDVSPVMDTHSWPALSKAPPKSASTDSLLSEPASQV